MEHKYKEGNDEFVVRCLGTEVFVTQVQKKSENEIVCITERFDRKQVIRRCDPQSGSSIVAFPTYRVIVATTNDDPFDEPFVIGKRSYENLTMEEVYVKYPWFFKALIQTRS